MKGNYRHTLFASYTGYITQAIVNNLAPLLFFTFQTQYGFSLEQIGFLVTFNFGMQMLIDFLSAKFVDRIGYRPCIVAAHIFSFLGLLGLGILPNLLPNAYIGIILSIVVYAVGGGLIEVLISPIVEALPTEEKSSAMSLLHSFYCWGHVGVVILSTIFFTIFGVENWPILACIWSLVPLANAFAFAVVPIRHFNEESENIPIRRLFTMKLFWLLILLMLCSGASEQAMSQWASIFAESGLNVNKTMGDLLGPCMFAILMGLSRTWYGTFGAKVDLKSFIMGSSILCVGGYLLAVFAPHPLLSLAGCALCGLSVGIMWPGIFSIGAQTCPQGGTAMFALFALAGDIGCASGPSVVGSVADMADGALKNGLLAAIVFPLILFCGVGILKKRRQAVFHNVRNSSEFPTS